MKQRLSQLVCLLLFYGMIPFSYSASEFPDKTACQLVRFANVGWSDTIATTALASEILNTLGYETRTVPLSIPNTYLALRQQEIDVFLGNWMPVMMESFQPFLLDHSIEIIGTILRHARSTLAVPEYVHEAGVEAISQLSDYKSEFHGRIFGIDVGSNGNKKIGELIHSPVFGLGGWQLIASSEREMLAEVGRAVKKREWIVFIGWEPHPMNRKFKIYYLDGGDQFLGAKQGNATVHISTRANYSRTCPEVARFLKNFTLDNRIENELMELIIDQGLEPKRAAQEWLHRNWKVSKGWLTGLRSLEGERAFSAIRRKYGDGKAANPMIESRFSKIPLDKWVGEAALKVLHRFEPLLQIFSKAISRLLEELSDFLLQVSPAILIFVIAGLRFLFRGRVLFSIIPHTGRKMTVAFWLAGLKEAVLTGALLALIWNQGYWTETIETAVLVAISVLTAAGLGIPIGIYCIHQRRVHSLILPMLNFMKAVPSVLYLLPSLLLFGSGSCSAFVSTIFYIIPTFIFFTYNSVENIPIMLVETSEAFGVSALQKIFLVELPYTLTALRRGSLQALRLSLSMVVLGAIIGGEGLGRPLLQSLYRRDIVLGFEAGLMIVTLWILIVRTSGVTTETSMKLGGLK